MARTHHVFGRESIVLIIKFALLVFITALCLNSFGDNNKTHSCESDTRVSPHCGITPGAAFDPQGNLWVAYVVDNHLYLSQSKNKGTTYLPAIKITKQKSKFYTNGENRPKIAFDQGGNIYLSWTKKTEGMFTGDVQFSRSTDAGKTFTSPITINDDGLLTSHRFDSMTVTPKGRIYITWLDKRNKVKAIEEGLDYIGAALYYSYSDNQGETFSRNTKIVDNTCECCRVATTFGPNNSVNILWRHIFDGSIRDHAYANVSPEKVENNLITLVADDHWETNACPHHGPSISNSANVGYHASWFSAGSKHRGVYYGKIINNSLKARNIMAIDKSNTASHPYVVEHKRTVYYVWKSSDKDKDFIKLATSSNDGKNWSHPKIIAHTNNFSDHPLLVTDKKDVYLIWKRENENILVKAL